VKQDTEKESNLSRKCRYVQWEPVRKILLDVVMLLALLALASAALVVEGSRSSPAQTSSVQASPADAESGGTVLF